MEALLLTLARTFIGLAVSRAGGSAEVKSLAKEAIDVLVAASAFSNGASAAEKKVLKAELDDLVAEVTKIIDAA
jgi:F0F1-type ATP synthase alpha subunit